MTTNHDPYEEKVTDRSNRQMRKASGAVDIDGTAARLTSFLYTLARDHVTTGVLELQLDAIENGDDLVMFTNGWLARWAEYHALRLLEGVSE